MLTLLCIVGYLLSPVLVLALILRTSLFSGGFTSDAMDFFREIGHPPPAPPFKGGETFRRCFLPREGRFVNGAFHQGRGDFSTVLSTKGGETFRRCFPPREGRLFDGPLCLIILHFCCGQNVLPEIGAQILGCSQIHFVSCE